MDLGLTGRVAIVTGGAGHRPGDRQGAGVGGRRRGDLRPAAQALDETAKRLRTRPGGA